MHAPLLENHDVLSPSLNSIHDTNTAINATSKNSTETICSNLNESYQNSDSLDN